MASSMRLMRFVAKAALNAVAGGVLADVIFEVLPEMAKRAFGWWSDETDERERRDEVQRIAQMSSEQAKEEAEQAVRDVAGDRPESIQIELVSYLSQMPAVARQSQRRPEDPTGRTVSPGLSLSRPNDLIPLLPTGMPRHKKGDRPIPGVPWELQELLGMGGFGEVWKAHNPDFPGLVAALKFCLDPRAAQSLRNEAKVLNHVMQQGRHPGIVTLRQVHVQSDWLCLEYEHVDGGDLCGLIQQMHASGAPAADETTNWMRHLLSPIRYAHQLNPPIVHRDLKPANVLVERGVDGMVLRVTDFGIGGLAAQQALEKAQFTSTQASRLVSSLRGSCTPLYASKQQQNGDPPDPRDDVHALGVIWFQMLTGDLTAGPGPDWRDDLADLNVPGAVVDLLRRCLASKAERRIANAALLADALEALPEYATTPKGDLPSAVSVASPKTVEPAKEVPSEHQAKEPDVESKSEASAISNVMSQVGEAISTIAAKIESSNLSREITTSISMRLTLLPAGTFQMGSPDSEHMRATNEGPVHEVAITKPFYVGTFPVTQEQYLRVMGNNPSWFSPSGPGRDKVRGLDHARLPVESVSWDEAMEFCRRLTEMEQADRPGWTVRLPTEAEWEYCARNAGAAHACFCFGESLTSAQANFNGLYPYQSETKGKHLERTSPVGAFPASDLGLRDLHGNTWEWCLDWFADGYYQNSPREDPPGPPRGLERSLRGGSWCDLGWNCRSACRYKRAPSERDSDMGFRIAMVQ